MWDLVTRKRFDPPLAAFAGAVYSVAVSNLDGTPIVVSGGKGGTMRLWSLGPLPA